jgi:hypothetical protein
MAFVPVRLPVGLWLPFVGSGRLSLQFANPFHLSISRSSFMTKWITGFLAITLLGASMTTAYAADKKDPEEVFKKLDKDNDGKLSLTEFIGKRTDEKATAAEKTFKAKDKDGDGFLTLEEFKAPVKKNK